MKPLNITQITGSLFLSNKVWPERDLVELHSHGIGAIVNLVEDHTYDAPPLIACLNSGFPDSVHVSPDQLQEIYSFIDFHQGGTHVLVHCSAGVSRSAGIVVGQLLREDPGWTWDEAFGVVNEKRSVWVSVETRESVLAYLGNRATPSPSELHESDAEALRQIQVACGVTLRQVSAIGWNSQGYVSEKGRVVGLGLCNMDLAIVPKAISRLDMLEKLSLCDNRIETLPGGISTLGNLKNLNVSGNDLKSLPGQIGDLAHLRVLNAAHNRLEAIPDGIRKLHRLEYLYLHNNRIASLPEGFGELTAMMELYLQNNCIDDLPSGIGSLSRLQRFSAYGNQIDALPASIGKLTFLTALSLSQNQLIDLPDDLGGLTRLDNLNVSNNRLETLPGGITALDQLRRLNIALNRFDILPPVIERWLEELGSRGCIVIRRGIY